MTSLAKTLNGNTEEKVAVRLNEFRDSAEGA